MDIKSKRSIIDFWIVGINYKKTDAGVRGLFAINNEQYAQLLSAAPQFGLNDLFILSTCNRTEVYGFADSAKQMMRLLCSQTEGDIDTLSELAYIKNGWDAIQHIFSVSAGLDSQILGDYEILGQIKNAVKFAKGYDRIDAFMERLANSVIQSSKAVKTYTALSGGTVSVSFAAVQYIKEFFKDTSDIKIVLIGTGKIGRNTCKNLVHYLSTNKITLINRTEGKAAQLAAELNLRSVPYDQLDAEAQQADVIMVATNAQEPTLRRRQLEGYGSKLVIDLSMPCNVSLEAQLLPNITFIDVDRLSKIKDETLQKRQAEVPKAMDIIAGHIAEFEEWYEMRKHVPLLKEVKNKLKEIHTDSQQQNSRRHLAPLSVISEDKIQKVINTLATKVRSNNTVGCHYIEAINEFIG